MTILNPEEERSSETLVRKNHHSNSFLFRIDVSLSCATPVSDSSFIYQPVYKENTFVLYVILIYLFLQVIVLGLSLVTWILGAASIIQPGGFETVFSLFYCGVACSLGTFILFFWCFARNDVREQWDAMCCLSCRRRRGRCCRTRSVSDAVLALPPQVPVGPPSQTGLAPVLASSVVSARSTTPSLNGSSNAAKMAAVELNHNTEAGIVPTANVNINKTANWPNARFIPNNNVNLVVLRQHQYRFIYL